MWQLWALLKVVHSLNIWENLGAVWIRALELQLLQSGLHKSIHFLVLNKQRLVCAFLWAVVSALLSLPVLNTILTE